jgi:type II secretory pathway pseudopilin PulG
LDVGCSVLAEWPTTNAWQQPAAIYKVVTFTKKSRAQRRRNQRGYILLYLVLLMSLAAIWFTKIAADEIFAAKRDREEELIHRGVQYSRAVRRYVKKFGRYPTRIEDLENTNNFRFLRKRYKDPITDKDFKLLHLGEVQLTFGPGIAGAQSIGQNPANPQPADKGAAGGQGQTSGSGSDTTEGKDNTSSDKDSGEQQLGNQVFGGGPIVGVASISKDKTIRVFNKKDHYNQWQFIYDPSTDRGGLLNTPAQPPLQGSISGGPPGMPGGIPGQPTPPGTPPPAPPPSPPPQ